tara:strand:+ start:698 stop:1216 length:519 start_codon:yes stop_codon:yes gene_type:complete
MSQVMIDLETLDTKPSSVVLSIGAVEFNPETGEVFKETGYEMFPDIQEQLDAGRTISASTLLWWMGQGDEARGAITKARRKSVKECLEHFRWWCQKGSRCKAWGNGSVFDITMMEDLMDHTQIPWKFWDIRDTRTLWDIHPYDKNKKGETAHTALEDAIAQAERVCEVWPKK